MQWLLVRCDVVSAEVYSLVCLVPQRWRWRHEQVWPLSLSPGTNSGPRRPCVSYQVAYIFQLPTKYSLIFFFIHVLPCMQTHTQTHKYSIVPAYRCGHVYCLVDVAFWPCALPCLCSRCGLVALCMAGQQLGATGVTVDKVLAKARYLGFTNNGEMFSGMKSAYYFLYLASRWD